MSLPAFVRVSAAGCVAAVFLSACSSYSTYESSGPSSSRVPEGGANVPNVIDLPRSARGNPPFYEVFGERYYVMETGAGYRASGVASWYGRDFHGRSTSSGEEYDMYAYTAAHKTLPIPTWVEVTNQRNGRRVIVKVNDRGPFVDDRIIDLSFAAADEIGMVQDGTAPVVVRALGAPDAARAPLTASSSSSPGGGFSIISSAQADEYVPGSRPFRQQYLQVGAFSSGENADQLLRRLHLNGFSESFIIPDNASPSGLHLVRVGPLADEAEIDSMRIDLNAIGVDAHLVLEP